MKQNRLSRISIAVVIALLTNISTSVYAVDFNTDVLDVDDKDNIDFSRFSQAGYVMPGKYQLYVLLNGQSISPSSIAVEYKEKKSKNYTNKKYAQNKMNLSDNVIQENNSENDIPRPCLTDEIVSRMGLTMDSLDKITWGEDKCADLSALPGVTMRTEPSDEALYITMPQAWLEYTDATWLPPSRWDNGIPGLLLDYNINGMVEKQQKEQQKQSLSYYGSLGMNMGAWRLRSDYQGNIRHETGSARGTDSDFSWNRFYMYRAVPSLKAKITLGENDISSDIFSTWRYTGASIESDDRMLPPKLRGYAPQITGVADTNARVVIMQQGRVLYDATVPAGPFSIQDLDSSVRGRLNVEITEQNGKKKRFDVDTAYVPYLTRPGQIRYKLVAGRSRAWEHRTEGPVFGGGEVSWGISNRWSVYGGGITAGDYNSVAFGLGRDLGIMGTLSADVTQSVARFDNYGTKQGKSWRLSYSKRFDQANADITFAGYRFSERDYMTMQQYLDTRYRGDSSEREKEMYTISVNKHFEDLHTSVSLQYNHQTYWDRRTSDYYTLSLDRYFDAFNMKNISLGLTATRSKYLERDDDALFLRLSIPFDGGFTSYSASMNGDRYTQTAGYSSSLSDGLGNYSINAGASHGGGESAKSQFNGYFTRNNPMANISANFAMVQNSYTAFGVNASGGATITAEGGALHAGGMYGGTRLLVDTDGVGGVPVDGGRVSTNRWGIGVVPDVSSYYRNVTSVDMNKLPEDIEATRSVVESALTEGAIGYRKFEVLKGSRLFAILRQKDGGFPPFGASVMNKKGRELGMVSDGGLAWLAGISPGEQLNVSWDGRMKCSINVPKAIKPEQQLLLPCE